MAGAATGIFFVTTKRVATNVLSRRNTSFVTIKVCLLRQKFCRDKIFLSRQNYVCCDKCFVGFYGTYCRPSTIIICRSSLHSEFAYWPQDPNTNRFKRTLIYFNTDTQYARTLSDILFQIFSFFFSTGPQHEIVEGEEGVGGGGCRQKSDCFREGLMSPTGSL